jgi:hypothetical protein
MSVHIVIQPIAGYGADVIEPSPGVRELVAGSDQAGFTVQVPARIGGLADTARFARSLATAAGEFAAWCEDQNRNRSVDEQTESWTRIDTRNSTDERE